MLAHRFVATWCSMADARGEKIVMSAPRSRRIRS